MSKIRTIFKNMSWLLISQIIASVCGFVWTVLMARYLGVNNYGILGFAVSITGILGVIDDLGISYYIVRQISTDNESAPKYLGNSLPLKIIFATIKLILTFIILILLKTDEFTILITLLFSFEMIIKSYINSLNGAFQAFENTKFQGIGITLMNTTTLLFILISIYADLGLLGVSISYIIANLITFIYSYYVLNKHITKPKFELDWEFCKKITLFSLPFAISGMLYIIYYSIDMVMLSELVGDYANGIYNATYKLIAVLNLFYSVYTAVIFPVMSKFFKDDKKLLVISYEKSIKYLMLVMIPLATGTVFYSLDIIQLIYGHQYDAAASVLSILIWTVCLLFISGASNTLLNASHKEVTVTKIYAIAAVFNTVLNFFMIPYLSYNGAAITTVLSDILIVALQTYAIRRIGHKANKKLYSDLTKIIIGSAVLGIALYFLNLNMWVALPVGIIIYFAVVYILRVFDNDDMYVIKEILGRN
ncbi:flippase [uncultured Methanobrevibacter sp.]|uniref:flippase n=1 Tax=uncultured Methanobrevibacter sp. TaxID=253161 RepID=UPI0025F64DBB|nr:flippase [uncultured Methanobrevibacter sp.]